jgi:hypothetical protein
VIMFVTYIIWSTNRTYSHVNYRRYSYIAQLQLETCVHAVYYRHPLPGLKLPAIKLTEQNGSFENRSPNSFSWQTFSFMYGKRGEIIWHATVQGCTSRPDVRPPADFNVNCKICSIFLNDNLTRLQVKQLLAQIVVNSMPNLFYLNVKFIVGACSLNSVMYKSSVTR